MTVVNGRLTDAEADRLSLGLGHPAAAYEVGRRIQCIAFRDSKAVIEQGTFNSTTQGYGVALSVSSTGGSRFYADDDGTVFTPSGSVPDIKNVLARTLITTDHSGVNARCHSIMGHLKSYNGEWGDEQWSAVHGYVELVRAAGTRSLQQYGVTAGLMATVETAGDMTIDSGHILAGVAAISKLQVSGTLTQTGKSAAFLAGRYDTTNWSDGSFTPAKWKYGLYVDANACYQGVRVGVGHATTIGYAIPIDRSTTTAANRFYADDAGASLAGSGSVPDIRGSLNHTLITVNQSAGHVRVFASQDMLSCYNGYWNTEVVAASEGRLQIVNTAQKTFGGYGITAAVMGTFSTGASSSCVINTNHVFAGVAAIADLKGTVTQTGKACAMYVGIYNTSQWSDATTRNKWGYGLYIDGTSASNGIYASEITLATYANKGFEMYTTSASADGSNSVEAMYVKSTLTAAGGVGGRSRFHTYTNAALGGWCNGLKGYMEFGSAGRVTGLASAVCAELKLSAGTTSGTYAAIEAELVAGSGASASAATAFLYCNASGDGATAINSGAGYFAILDTGVTDTAGGIVEAEVVGACASTHKLKIKALGVDMWIPLNTAKNA